MSGAEDAEERRFRYVAGELGFSDGDDDARSSRQGDAMQDQNADHNGVYHVCSARQYANQRAYAGSHSSSEDRRQYAGAGSGPQNEGRGAGGGGGGGSGVAVGMDVDAPPDVHLREVPDYDASKMGDGISPVAPCFNQGATMPGGWQEYAQAGVSDGLVPARVMCINIPAECLNFDAHKFSEWQTPMKNSVRAASIAALIGMIATPLSKGWLSGRHEELERDDGDGVQGGGEKKGVKRVWQYMMPSDDGSGSNVPMFVVAYEEVYNPERTAVVAIRVWHMVFDPSHSTSELAEKLMMESRCQSAHSGMAHCSTQQKSDKQVKAGNETRVLLGPSLESTELELAAGMCWRHITDLSEYKNLLPAYAGQTDKSSGLHPMPGMEDYMPQGLFNQRLERHDRLGCTHPLALEWVFNAKRTDALRAGLVSLEGDDLDVHPDQVDPSSYFNMSEEGLHAFRVPEWVAEEKRCFFFQTTPFRPNIFDMVLPRPIAGNVSPGPTLLGLFRERFAPNTPVDSPALLNQFINEMTGRDQSIEKHIKALADSIVGFDHASCSREQRRDAILAKRAVLTGGIASYGQMDGNDHVIEPRQVLKDHALATSHMFKTLIQPWAYDQKRVLIEMEVKLRSGENTQHMATDLSHDHFEELRIKRDKFKERHNAVMEELCKLHLAKMERSFNSRMESESIPAGFRACWSGLQKELDAMPDKTANIAQALNMQMMESDRTVFGHMTNWLGTYFEDDCFVDGRDWRLMQELFFHCFEQYGEQTLLLIFCGPKGNGKTLRTERAMKAFVEGWITMSGPSSAKAGMQGNSDSCNGSNCVYDEMIDELTDSDGSNRTEYWKMILLKREYVYNKPVVVKGKDGMETMRTFKLKTPHQETHCVCTNRGPAFTKGQEDPSEVKSALIDRAVVQFVRTLGSKTHTDEEFEAHMSEPEVINKTRAFRILTCLMGLTKMLIFRLPFFRPDTAMAQKMWDEWDNMLDTKYGLPRPSPRKNMKRLENLVTMTVMNAVAEVFFFRQTSYKFEAGKVTEEFAKGKPFEISMLWEVVQLLQPTPEMIHQAWTMGLEYNIGTSCMGLNTLTIIAEVTGRKPGDWFTKPIAGDFSKSVMTKPELEDIDNDIQLMGGGGGGGGGDGDGEGSGKPQRKQASRWKPPSNEQLGAQFPKWFESGESTMSKKAADRLRSQLKSTREARAIFRHRCSRSELQNQLIKDAQNLVDSALGDSIATMHLDVPIEEDEDEMEVEEVAAPPKKGPHNEGRSPARAKSPSLEAADKEGPPENDPFRDSDDDDETDYARGARYYKEGKNIDAGNWSPHCCMEMQRGFHFSRSVDYPGSANCAFGHAPGHAEQPTCPYCMTDLPPAMGRLERDEPDRAAAAAAAEADGSEEGGDKSSSASVIDVEKEATTLSSAASRTWPTVLEASMFYKPQTIVQMAAGEGAHIGQGGNNALGTKPFGASFKYKPKKSGLGGAAQVDVAWIQADGDQWKSWHKIASFIKERSGSRTCAEFDFHIDGIRDCLYLCSTRDNARRCPEEPRVPRDMRPEKNFVGIDNSIITSSHAVVKVNDYSLPTDPNVKCPAHHQHLPRDPASGVKNTPLQRRMDSLYHGGRLSALGVITSNRVVSSPPIRLHQDGLEINIGALHDHMALIAESVLVCSKIPGMHNEQEKFSNNQPGPDGLSVPPREERRMSGKKRGNDDQVKEPEVDPESNVMMPYSYDVASTAISWDMAEMMYDDLAEKRVKAVNDRYGKPYDLDVKVEELPHMSMRFIGYSEANRQTLSFKLPTKKPDGQDYVEAGDPAMDESTISKRHVQRSLARKCTDQDVVNYISRRQGSRSMKGVTGDLFASSTWLRHTLATLEDRGLIKGKENEVPVRALCDMGTCLQARVAEHGCEKAKGVFKALGLCKASPGTYEALEKERCAKAAAAAQQQKDGHDSDAARVAPLLRQINAPRVRLDAFAAGDDDEGLEDCVEEGCEDGAGGGDIGLGAGPVRDRA